MSLWDLSSLAETPTRRRKLRLKGAGACLDAIDACRVDLPDIYAALLRKSRSRQQLDQLRKLYDGRHEWTIPA